MINRRLEGVVVKIYKTLGTVLAKQVKLGARSIKQPRLDCSARNLKVLGALQERFKTQKLI